MREQKQHNFDTHDGVSLSYRHWSAEQQSATKRAVVLFHRGHEHGGRMAHLVDELQLPDCDFFAWDARGHGESPGARGDSPGFSTSVRDVQTFIEHITERHGIPEQEMIVIAQSVGAVLISTWAHDYAPKVRALVLASPAFKVKLYVPFARPGLKLLRAMRGNFFVNSYVKAKFLTHDPERIASFEQDPLITRPISVNMLLGLYEAAERVVADARAIQVPVQLFISGADWVVHRKPQLDFFQRLGTPHKEQHILPGFYHDTLGERDRAQVNSRITRFVRYHFDHDLPRPDLRNAHLTGSSCAETEALSQPLPTGSLMARYWALNRQIMKLGSRWSEGIKLGFETGFDSGSTLDYVYRNKPSGKEHHGRFIDKMYLNSIGWRGIRQRKVHLEELLQLALSKLDGEQHILDIAAGHGRYILDAIASQKKQPDSVLLRDYSDINVRDGQALIEEKGMDTFARFIKGDAFDRASLSALDGQKNLAVVSGLYELFGDNDMVSESLNGVADALKDGGYLIYTGQPWHPQLELIARALTSHRDGQPWVMRLRCQAEMDQLVADAGFEKVTQRIDQWEIGRAHV